MYVHVDVKERRRPIGWAADLCPICRDLRAFEVAEVRRVARIYMVPIGSGTLEGQEITCAGCRTVMASPPGGYAALAKRRREPAVLVETTNPALLDQVDAWFERQARIACDSLSKRERIAEMLSVFGALEHMAWVRSRGGPEELVMLLCVVFFVIMLVVTLASWSLVTIVGQAFLLAALFSSFTLGAVLMLVHRPLAAARCLTPRIIQAIEPLDPTEDELNDALALARRNGLRIGRYINAGRLARAFARERQRPVVVAEFG